MPLEFGVSQYKMRPVFKLFFVIYLSIFTLFFIFSSSYLLIDCIFHIFDFSDLGEAEIERRIYFLGASVALPALLLVLTRVMRLLSAPFFRRVLALNRGG